MLLFSVAMSTPILKDSDNVVVPTLFTHYLAKALASLFVGNKDIKFITPFQEPTLLGAGFETFMDFVMN